MNFNTMIFQIGKNGLTSGVIDSLHNALKTHNQIRITVLKSTKRDKESIKELASSIQNQLNIICDYRIIGFTIIVKRKGKGRKKPLESEK